MHEDMKFIVRGVQVEKNVLNAIAISLSSQKGPKKLHGLRPQTRAQLSTLDFYLSPELLTKVGVHIIIKFVVARAGDMEHTFEAPHEVLDILSFAPSAQERQRKRKTVKGEALREMRISLALGYLHNCSVRARVLKDKNASALKAADSAGLLGVDGSASAEHNAAERAQNYEAHVEQPIRTEPNYISAADIKEACNTMMGKKKRSPSCNHAENGDSIEDDESPRRKRRKSNPPKQTLDEEIRKEIVKEVWRRETEWLNVARQEARRFLTKALAFLFVSESNATWDYTAPREYFGRADTCHSQRLTRAWKWAKLVG